MEQIKDVSIIQPLLSGQVLVFNGEIWQNLVPQNLLNDTMGSLLEVNISCTIFIIFINITKMVKYKYH